MSDGNGFWSYMSAEPLLWLSCTILFYLVAEMMSSKSGRHPLVNPVLITVCMTSAAIWLVGTPYQTYFEGAQFLHFLLGPATVALAVPLFANRSSIRRLALPMLAALLAGSVAAVFSASLLALAVGLPDQLVISMSVKSTTAPVAISISEALGGQPSLTAVLVILTGIIGALLVTPLMNALKIRDWRARGFAIGVAAHGIGTARAFQVNNDAGTFAGVGMALNAILTSVLAPLVVKLLL